MIISISVATAILPTISAARALKNSEDIKEKSAVSLKLVWIIALPCFVGLMLMAPDITHFLYAKGLSSGQVNEMAVATSLIRIGAISIIYMSLLRIFVSILHAMDKSFISVINLSIASIIKIAITILVVSVSTFNIYGAGLASAFSYSIGCVLNLIFVKKYINLQFDIKEFLLLPALAILLMTVVIALVKYFGSLILSPNLTTLVAIVLGGVTYCIMLIVLNVFNKTEMKYIKTIEHIKNKLKTSQ